MPANKEHPDYPAYIEKCKQLRVEFLEESKDLWTPTGVLDGNSALHEAQRRHNRKLKKLQEEYSYLFEPSDE